jgi:phage repressor protein C with HTH and peptisase S24 domain
MVEDTSRYEVKSSQKVKYKAKNFYGQRLRYVRRQVGIQMGVENLSQAKFAKILDVHPSTISHVEAGNTRLQPELAKKIEERTGFSQAWMLTGEGNERIDSQPENRPGNLRPPIRETIVSGFSFSFIGKVKPRLSGGSGNLVYDENYEDIYSFRTDWLFQKGLLPKNMRLAQVNGDSMLPTLEDGDMVLFDTSKTDPLDGKIMVVGIDDYLYVKRIRRSPEGIFLVSDNKSVYEPWRIDPDDARWLGQVIWHCGDL